MQAWAAEEALVVQQVRLSFCVVGMLVREVLAVRGVPAAAVEAAPAACPVALLFLVYRGCQIRYTSFPTPSLAEQRVQVVSVAIQFKTPALLDTLAQSRLLISVEIFAYSIHSFFRLRNPSAPAGFHDDCVIALALANHRRWQTESCGAFLPLSPRGISRFISKPRILPG